jgi:hypothetical protein
MTDFGKLDLFKERIMNDAYAKFYSPSESSPADKVTVLLEHNSFIIQQQNLKKPKWFSIHLQTVKHDHVTVYLGKVNKMHHR